MPVIQSPHDAIGIKIPVCIPPLAPDLIWIYPFARKPNYISLSLPISIYLMIYLIRVFAILNPHLEAP